MSGCSSRSEGDTPMGNDMLCCPSGTVTSAAGVSLEPVVWTLTAVPPGGAARINSTAHTNVPVAFSSGEHDSAEIELEASTVRVADAPIRLMDAATMAVSFGSTFAPALTGKDAVEDPGETTTKGGTMTDELVLARVTVPPCVSGRVTVQMLEEPGIRAEGAQTSDRTPGSVVRLTTAAIQDAFSVALIVALWSAGMTPALIAKERVADPGVTVTVPGAVRAALSVLMLTVPPAAVESVTVQAPDPSCDRVVGVHDNEIRREGVVRSIARLKAAPLSDAVKIAFSSAAMVPAVTTNDA
jgi:hypothetical protein